jgi:hypothetical protein
VSISAASRGVAGILFYWENRLPFGRLRNEVVVMSKIGSFFIGLTAGIVTLAIAVLLFYLFAVKSY